jgi:hypothetical protein
MNVSKLTLREEITAAILNGFDGRATAEVADDKTTIQVEDMDEPIYVLPDDVIVPEAYPELASAIALDVQAIFAMWE